MQEWASISTLYCWCCRVPCRIVGVVVGAVPRHHSSPRAPIVPAHTPSPPPMRNPTPDPHCLPPRSPRTQRHLHPTRTRPHRYGPRRWVARLSQGPSRAPRQWRPRWSPQQPPPPQRQGAGKGWRMDSVSTDGKLDFYSSIFRTNLREKHHNGT